MAKTESDMFLESRYLIRIENGNPVLDENGQRISIADEVRPDTSWVPTLGGIKISSKETYNLIIKNISMEDYQKIVGLGLTNLTEIVLTKN